ncbi:MAG TPA: DUF1376 domain-containing protein [Stellaceae bacterium]|nr:DUF1376 domain-containing protein [Stellaceae bacterium]
MKPRRFDWHPGDWLDGVAGLKPEERGIYDTIINLIYSHASDDDWLDMDERELALRCCCHWRQLRRVLAALVEKGKIEQDGRRIYIKRCAEELQRARSRMRFRRPCADPAAVLRQSCGSPAASETPQELPTSAENNGLSEIPPSTIHHPPSSHASHETRARDGGFSGFWEAYPHKVGKAAARAAYVLASQRASPAALAASAKRYGDTKPPDRQWCNPAKWLAEERWLDEPAEVVSLAEKAAARSSGPKGPPPELPEELRRMWGVA